MGLRMDDLHAPTVASGPTSTPSSSFDPSTDKRPLLELIDLKQNMEEELSALGSVLDSHNVTLTTSLTDRDDYPRSDIDVAQIRTTRARIIHLRNDYKALMKKIETGLHERHAQYRASQPPPSTDTAATSIRPQSSQPRTASLGLSRGEGGSGLVETPFAKINTVAGGGPAEQAGLRPGDRIRRIGDVNWLNHEKLAKVAEVVQRNQGREVLVRVSRARQDNGEAEELELQLVPRANWGGRGLLGCHLLPL